MGIDIHSVAQILVESKWKTVATAIGGDNRNYGLFGPLAGIGRTEAIQEPRGVPPDFDMSRFMHAFIQDDQEHNIFLGHDSHSWFTLEELSNHFAEREAQSALLTAEQFQEFDPDCDEYSDDEKEPDVIFEPMQYTVKCNLADNHLDDPDWHDEDFRIRVWFAGRKHPELAGLVNDMEEIACAFYVEPSDIRIVFGFDTWKQVQTLILCGFSRLRLQNAHF